MKRILILRRSLGQKPKKRLDMEAQSMYRNDIEFIRQLFNLSEPQLEHENELENQLVQGEQTDQVDEIIEPTKIQSATDLLVTKQRATENEGRVFPESVAPCLQCEEVRVGYPRLFSRIGTSSKLTEDETFTERGDTIEEKITQYFQLLYTKNDAMQWELDGID
ncbi:hypothetical protein Scep_006847 [Stephania cephalantha]|uniref:Uncharacterized protein n=1 Tax=Stephania cephalantha TaxID=152367 RepID=A0AAP0PNA7_9MAGN